jgi:hypothetical protein
MTDAPAHPRRRARRFEGPDLEKTQPPKPVRKAVDIDVDELRAELARTPSDRARFSVIAAEAHGAYRRARAERERVMGELKADPDFVRALEEKLSRKPTVDQLTAEILSSDEYQEALELEIQADVERKRTAGYAAALSDKIEMLGVLGRLVARERADGLADEDDPDEDEEDEDRDPG